MMLIVFRDGCGSHIVLSRIKQCKILLMDEIMHHLGWLKPYK